MPSPDPRAGLGEANTFAQLPVLLVRPRPVGRAHEKWAEGAELV